MRTTVGLRPIVLIAIMFAAGCTTGGWDGVINPADRPAEKTAFPEISDWETLRISADHGGCPPFPCPGYRVEIAGDGTVTYDGKFLVSVAGHRTARISRAKIHSLVQKFRRAEFFWADGYYWGGLEDGGSYSISIAFDGRTKTIDCRDGGGPPPGIYELMDEVDRTAGTARWVGRTW